MPPVIGHLPGVADPLWGPSPCCFFADFVERKTQVLWPGLVYTCLYLYMIPYDSIYDSLYIYIYIYIYICILSMYIYIYMCVCVCTCTYFRALPGLDMTPASWSSMRLHGIRPWCRSGYVQPKPVGKP